MTDDPLRVLGEAQREADAIPSDDSPMSAELENLLEPFDGDERAQLLDGVFARLDSGEASPETELDAEEDADAEPVATPIDLAAERKSRRSAWIGVAVAVAAALLLWFGLSRGPSGPQPSGLPAYGITQLEGGPKTMRSDDEGVPTRLELSAEDRIEVVITPASPVKTKVAAAVLAVPEGGGEPIYAPLTAEVVPETGVVRIAGPLRDFVQLSPGSWHLTVLIGAPNALPTTPDEAMNAGPWERVELDLVVSSPASASP
jgi:hypothetical protein